LRRGDLLPAEQISAHRSATAVAADRVDAILAFGLTLTRALEDSGAARDVIHILAARLRDPRKQRLAVR
jgi:hypothetical protein